MAVGYYDPNKDYSKAISEAKAAGKDTSKLEAERQNKIDDKYGGKEPNMYGSDKTFSQASRDNDRDTISNAISISNGRGSSSSSSNGNRNTGGNVSTPSYAAPVQQQTQLPALNQYGYRDMDYSSVIPTVTDAALRQQLLQERDNKIKYQYGNAEPNMIGSNQTFSKTLAGSSVDLVKGPGYYTGGYTLGVNGTPILTEKTDKSAYWKKMTNGVDLSRRTDLKNSMAVSNGYTVFYDEDGYAIKAVKGAVDYLPRKDLNASNGSYNTSGAWTDIEMMGDKPGSDYYKIQDIRAALQRGEITGDQANQLANQIRSGYGYTIDKQGNVYDSGVGASVAARRTQYGLDTNVTDAQQKYLQLMFPEQVNQDNGSLLSAYVALKNGNYNPNTVYTGLQSGQKYAGDYASQNVGVNGGVNLGSYGSGYGGSYGGGYGGGYGADISDASQYLRDMYAQQIAAELAALKSTYEQNLADISAQDDLISSAYAQQRNQAAAQNELQRMYMNEMGIMQGLNTGTTGQMALAQSAALQGNLATIGSQEAQSLADNALNLTKLTAQYKNAADQAAAEGNAQLASALYDEYVRQQELALRQQAAAQEQANWEAKMAYQQQQDALAQQNWQAQFDYQKAQDDLNYQLTLQKLYGSSTGNTGSTVRTRTPVKAKSVGYNNGGLTTAQVIQLQQDLNKYLPDGQKIAVDGKWGPATQAAAGGYTADEYARVYYKQNSWSGRSDR